MPNVHFAPTLHRIIDDAVKEAKRSIDNEALCEARDDWDKARKILCCTICKTTPETFKRISVDTRSTHAQVHIPRWFYLVERDATVILCPNHAQASWISQSPDDWTVVKMDDMKMISEVTNTQVQRGRNLSARVPSLIKYTEDSQINDDIKKLARHRGYPVPLSDKTAIVETTVNSKIPPPTTKPTTPKRAARLKSIHAHNSIQYDGYRKENQENGHHRRSPQSSANRKKRPKMT